MILRIKEEIKDLEEKLRKIHGNLRVRGDGEISVSRRIYPNCNLKIKGASIDINDLTLAATYFIMGREIKKI
jgi:hypothetical protein